MLVNLLLDPADERRRRPLVGRRRVEQAVPGLRKDDDREVVAVQRADQRSAPVGGVGAALQ